MGNSTRATFPFALTRRLAPESQAQISCSTTPPHPAGLTTGSGPERAGTERPQLPHGWPDLFTNSAQNPPVQPPQPGTAQEQAWVALGGIWFHGAGAGPLARVQVSRLCKQRPGPGLRLAPPSWSRGKLVEVGVAKPYPAPPLLLAINSSLHPVQPCTDEDLANCCKLFSLSVPTGTMSFSRSTSYSSSLRSPSIMGRRYAPNTSAASVYAGAGGSGSRISVARTTSLGSSLPGSSSGGSYGISLSGSGVVQNEKETMQDLNDRLASYLERVRSLETDNRKLELQIREFMDKKGPRSQDWSRYFQIIEDLRNQIFESAVGNARIVLQIDNARLAADDFRVKFESELAIRQSVESDINGLRKVLDDTNMSRLQLEGEIESLREELIFMKKNHQDVSWGGGDCAHMGQDYPAWLTIGGWEVAPRRAQDGVGWGFLLPKSGRLMGLGLSPQEVDSLQAQIANSGLTVEVDAAQPQDLGKVMAEIRAQYDTLAQKNMADLDQQWNQMITQSTAEITENTKEIEVARSSVSELRRTCQTLEIELESLRNLKASLEANLRDVEQHYVVQMEHLNGQLLRAEAELAQVRNDIQHQSEDYQALLNIKDKLEAEIATYRRLLEGGEEFNLRDALVDSSSVTQTTHQVVTTTKKLVDGKVVSETSESQVIKN
ncbi:keratin, type I cytoskeletal 18 isoform X1 [Chelonia mydas]|uniref:keratin, type I cytoskeletal 18 isoform X1 n=1 Tax=Chelonia mydas TaxID=8469 RepID=UPI001CA7C0A5|nr:keratin, type I cytoskeletal 18 isoform X1 [Chelonia mydas]